MISALIDRIRTGLVVRNLRRLPAVSTGRVLIQKYWTENHEAVKDFTPDFVKRQGEKIMEEILEMAVSPDPKMANRVSSQTGYTKRRGFKS